MDTFLAVTLTFIGTMLIFMIAFVGAMLFIMMKKKANPINISVFEYTKQGFQVKRVIGRFINDPTKGRSLVSCGATPKSIKFRFGEGISDNDKFSSTVNGRFEIMLANKDGVFVPFNFEEVDKTFSLKPIRQETIRFVLDTHKDAADLYNDKDKERAAFLMKSAVAIFIFTLVIVMVILVILINQGPAIADKLHPAAQVVAQNISKPLPGLPG